MNCVRCNDKLDCLHQAEHPTLCCDCYDLSWGVPLETINDERRQKGKQPIKERS